MTQYTCSKISLCQKYSMLLCTFDCKEVMLFFDYKMILVKIIYSKEI